MPTLTATVEALGDTLWAFLMSSGSGAVKLGSGSPKDTAMLIWTIVKLVLTFVEIVEIGDKVNNLGRGYSGIYRTFPSNYEIKGWDRYELTIYLWSQSSVGSNIAGLLLAVLIPWIGEDIKRSIKEANPFLPPCAQSLLLTPSSWPRICTTAGWWSGHVSSSR